MDQPPVKNWDATFVQDLALTLHGYTVDRERADKLAAEINCYLHTIGSLRARLAFDDAPADFDLILVSES